MANVAVVGAQWGDEGKGKIVDWLSNRADMVVRFQGGHNAGHTLVVDGKVYKLALLPSGVVQGKPSIIGNGVVVDPWHLVGEIEKIEAQGISISPDVLIVADNACLILPIHPALDVAREAHRLGIPFGRVADPVGRPVERGYALLPWTIAHGRGLDFARAFLRGVFAEGLDAGGDAGLRRIVETAGLEWTAARSHLSDTDWRAEAEANRREMTGLGLWGVPSFRVGDVAVWGQDRLWVIEAELKRLSERETVKP